MDYIGYDEYLAKFDSDPEDDDDPDIRQLKYNALFDEEEEEGWVIVLPGFKPYRYNIQPVSKPTNRQDDDKVVPHDSGLQRHDQIVSSMKEMTLTMSGKDYYTSEKMRSQRYHDTPKQRTQASETHTRYKEPQIYGGRNNINEATHKCNDYNRKTCGGRNNNAIHISRTKPRTG